VTEFDIGEFIIHGDAREVDGEFQAVIIMRAKPPLNKVTAHQVEKTAGSKPPTQLPWQAKKRPRR